MLKTFNLKEPVSIASLLLILSIASLISPLSYLNILFWVLLIGFNYLHQRPVYFLKKLVCLILILASLYLQFYFDYQTISKELFVHILGILMIFKFFELHQKRDYFFYVNLSFFISVISLLDGQDLISCTLSFAIMFFGIYLLYMINQIEFPDFKWKNLIKIFGFVLALFPFIIGTYLIFPRTHINISFLQPSQNKIGIPDKINLGSFNSITNTREKVFDVNFNNNTINQKELYFRVKVFDILNQQQEWIEAPNSLLYQFQTRISKKEDRLNYQLTMSAHGKKWLPVLDYVSAVGEGYRVHPYNFTSSNTKTLDKSKIFSLKSSSSTITDYLDQNAQSFYLKLPNQDFSKLKTWVDQNNSDSQQQFLNTVLNHFKNEEFFYTLSPKIIGNDYQKFFFETKEGYCEYYAGTFVILARLAGIPARIVTGYYGGEKNNIGGFYSFRQSDAHSWVEVYLKDKGWTRYDPTQIIPLSRVNLNNNLYLDQQMYLNKENQNQLTLINRMSQQFKHFAQYFSYIDYRWTQFFVSYNQFEQRKLYSKIKQIKPNDNVKQMAVMLSIGLMIISLIYILLIKRLFNLNFIIFEMIRHLKKKHVNINKYQDSSEIFSVYEKIFQNLNITPIQQVYFKHKFKNEPVHFFKRLGIFLRLKKIALTN